MLCGSFHESQRKRNFEPFLKTVLANQSKNEEENEKKMNSIFEFSISKWGNSHENVTKTNFEPFLRHFLTNWGKDEDENENIEFCISKLG